MKVFAYIHPQINTLCCALFPEAIPKGVNAQEFDVNSPEDVILDNGTIRVKTYAEKLNEAKQSKLSQLKTYTASLLSSTDYIITKISEAQLLNDTDQVEALKQKYSSQLQQRENIRVWGEQLKQAINNATTIEELNSIEIKFEGDV
jgi:hypothetical protein